MCNSAGHNNDEVASYSCSIPYEAKRIRAAAIYCSDGRVGEHFDDFLTIGLGLPRYDRIALPGGPVCMANRNETELDDRGIIENLHFLIKAHELERVVLIAHDGCAFYAHRLGIPPAKIEEIQRSDLRKAAALIREYTGLQRIETVFARIVDGGMRFEPVD